MFSRLASIVLAVVAAAVVLSDAPTVATAVVLSDAPTVATPTTLADVLSNAGSGAAIVLAHGQYNLIIIRGRKWSPAVSIDATEAQVRGVRINDVSGLTWHGGEFDGGDVERSGINVNTSDHIVIDGVRFSNYLRNGIGLGTVSDGRVTNNSFSNSSSDGINIAMSRRIIVDSNRCVDFRPSPGAHPDCIQLWSRPEQPPTSDIVIRNNKAIGDMQGFTAFNHVRKGIDDGGFDRITIEHNFARITAYHGVTVMNCRDCIIRHNRVETLPNARNPRSLTWIKVIGGDGVTNCDNVAAAYPNDPGRSKCGDGS
jgi:parallel beta-helix repeat protein